MVSPFSLPRLAIHTALIDAPMPMLDVSHARPSAPALNTCPAKPGIMSCTGRSKIEAVAGELHELTAGTRSKADERQGFYSELLLYARQREYNPRWAAHKYREKFGVWPRNLSESVAAEVSSKTTRWIKSRNIAWAKSRNRATLTYRT